MKAFLAISILFLCMAAQAIGDFPNYFFCRSWVERECATNSIPQGDRLFVGSFITKPYFANIIRFQKGITLRQIIDQTPLKGKTVLACVMWPDKTKTLPFTRSFDVTVGPADTPNFELHKLNVIWLLDDGPIINTSRSNKDCAAEIAARDMAEWFEPIGAEGLLPGAKNRDHSVLGQMELMFLGIGSHQVNTNGQEQAQRPAWAGHRRWPVHPDHTKLLSRF